MAPHRHGEDLERGFLEGTRGTSGRIDEALERILGNPADDDANI